MPTYLHRPLWQDTPPDQLLIKHPPGGGNHFLFLFPEKVLAHILRCGYLEGMDDYIEKRIELAESYGFNVILDPVEFKIIEGNFPCRGYFCEVDKEIYFATKTPDFHQIFIHEFCHFDQWLAGHFKPGGKFHSFYTVGVALDEYLEGKLDLTPTQAYVCARICRDMELDCEKRTVRQILKYDLPVNLEEIVKKMSHFHRSP